MKERKKTHILTKLNRDLREVVQIEERIDIPSFDIDEDDIHCERF